MGLKVHPGDGGGGYGVGFTGEWWYRTVIKNVEAADAVVEVVMGEELRKIHGLILYCGMYLVFDPICC